MSTKITNKPTSKNPKSKTKAKPMPMKVTKSPKIEYVFLDLGCGQNKQSVDSLFANAVIAKEQIPYAKVIGVDNQQAEGVDKVWDLTKFPYPFKDNSIDGVFSSHFLEHLDGLERIKFFNEMQRIMKTGSKMRHIHPYYKSDRAIQDPTHCFSDDTDVLTESGWKKLTDVSIGENIITLNQKTRETELSPCIKVISEKYVGDMVHFKNISMDCLVTPNHSMGWWSGGDVKKSKWDISDASTFLPLKGHHSRRADAIIKWNGIEFDEIEIPHHHYFKGKSINPNKFKAEHFMSFIGWYLAEGSVGDGVNNPTSNRICIAQEQVSNKEKYLEIKTLIESMGFNPNLHPKGVRFASKSLCEYLKPMGKQNSRYIPVLIKQLSPRLLDILLKSAIKGDGSGLGKSSTWRYSSISKRLADDIMEIAMKIGYRVSMAMEERKGLYKQFPNATKSSPMQDIYHVYISKNQTLHYPKAKKVFYDGRISCITVAHNNVIMVRRNGRVLWSGNCFPPICETSYMYWNKDWREANKLGHYLGNSNFGIVNMAYTWQDQTWATKNAETRDFAIRHYFNIVADMIVDLVKL